MEPEPSNKPNVTRKIKYAPKAQPRRAPKAEVKTEVVENADSVQAMDLLRRFNENQGKARAKFEKKVAPSQIAFGIGGASNSIRSFGVLKGGSSSSPFSGGAHGPGLREKEYKEPWDYYGYYPVSLPLRRPYSGNPELLDEEEFGEALEEITYDESLMKPAEELGLLEEDVEPSMFFLQLPPTLPMTKRSATADGQEASGSTQPDKARHAKEKNCSLNELPAGLMGKMVVYRSGAVKLKLGDTLYDVTPGLDCMFAQDAVAINTAEKNCCVIGEISKRAILTPDVNSVLNNFADL